MKVTYGATKRAYVYDVRRGAQPFKRLMKGERQIFPDNSARIATMALDMSVLVGKEPGVYWEYALDAVATTADSKCYIELKAGGRSYLLQSTYGNAKRALYSAGVVDFLTDGPVRGSLREGEEVTIKLVIPQRKTATIGGPMEGYKHKDNWNLEHGAYVEATYPVALPNTEIWSFFGHWKKKTATGNRIIIKDSRGNILMDETKREFSHKRDTFCWSWGVLPVTSGTVTMQVIPYRARGDWGAYLVYPAFTKTLRLKVTALTYTQQEQA